MEVALAIFVAFLATELERAHLRYTSETRNGTRLVGIVIKRRPWRVGAMDPR